MSRADQPKRAQQSLSIGVVGDLIFDAPDPLSFFAPTMSSLQQTDVLIGHVEAPYTLRGSEESVDLSSTPCDPDQLDGMATVGFDVATLAGNHIADLGTVGVTDTIEKLHSLNIATTGAGASLSAAYEPALLTFDGVTVGVLSANCIGPAGSKATSQKAGAAYVDVHTVYGMPYGGPGGAADDYDNLLGSLVDRPALPRSIDFA